MIFDRFLAVLASTFPVKLNRRKNDRRIFVMVAKTTALVLLFFPLVDCTGDRHQGGVIIASGWPSSVSLVGYNKKEGTPLYRIVLPGVYQSRDEIIIKHVVPNQKDAVLKIGVNEDGALSYSQCLALLDHLTPAYPDIKYASYSSAVAKKLQDGEEIRVVDFYALLKAGKVPPLSPSKLDEIKAAMAKKKP